MKKEGHQSAPAVRLAVSAHLMQILATQSRLALVLLFIASVIMARSSNINGLSQRGHARVKAWPCGQLGSAATWSEIFVRSHRMESEIRSAIGKIESPVTHRDERKVTHVGQITDI